MYIRTSAGSKLTTRSKPLMTHRVWVSRLQGAHITTLRDACAAQRVERAAGRWVWKRNEKEGLPTEAQAGIILRQASFVTVQKPSPGCVRRAKKFRCAGEEGLPRGIFCMVYYDYRPEPTVLPQFAPSMLGKGRLLSIVSTLQPSSGLVGPMGGGHEQTLGRATSYCMPVLVEMVVEGTSWGG
jgi:hypothetical protein